MSTRTPDHLRDLVEQMLGMIDATRYRVSGGSAVFEITLGGMTTAFDTAAASAERPLEQLASAIEAAIAHERAHAMLAAAKVASGPLPLWLVTGSSVLKHWLVWSNTEGALRRRLCLSDQVGLAPVAGKLERRARQALGQSAIKVRVRSGLAVGEQIDLPGRLRCVGTFGQDARIRIEGGPLPDTLITALDGEPFRNARRRLVEVVDHPFFAAAELELIGIRNDGSAIVVEVASEWAPLAPVPPAAWAALPRDVDPAHPWRPTRREVAALYGLVDAGRRHGRRPKLVTAAPVRRSPR